VFLKNVMKVIGYPTGFYFLKRHISYPDCRPTDIEAETNVYNHSRRSKKRSFYWIYFHCTTSPH